MTRPVTYKHKQTSCRLQAIALLLWCNLGYVIGKRVRSNCQGLKKAVLTFEYQLQSCGGCCCPQEKTASIVFRRSFNVRHGRRGIIHPALVGGVLRTRLVSGYNWVGAFAGLSGVLVVCSQSSILFGSRGFVCLHVSTIC